MIYVYLIEPGEEISPQPPQKWEDIVTMWWIAQNRHTGYNNIN